MDFDSSLKYAVIGASKDTSKYGFKILKHLFDLGINVVPVNPSADFILDLPVVKSVDSLGSDRVLVFLVPPSVSFKIVKHAINLGFKKFWFQPGSFDDSLLVFCSEKGVDFSAGVCLLHLG